MKTKTLIWDIEICASMNDTIIERLYTGFLRPGMLMSANMSHMLCFGYKWRGDKKIHCISQLDYPKDLKNDPNDDKKICDDALNILMEADHLVAHYGDKFDRKYLETRLLINKLKPIPSKVLLRQSDTCTLAKTFLKLDSNRLDVVARTLGLTPKMHKEWPKWWIDCMHGDHAAYKNMAKYCKQDIDTLEQVYDELEKYDPRLVNPNTGLPGTARICICGSLKVQSNGYARTLTALYQRYKCMSCGKCWRATKALETAEIR